jgi:hypothetical protein
MLQKIVLVHVPYGDTKRVLNMANFNSKPKFNKNTPFCNTKIIKTQFQQTGQFTEIRRTASPGQLKKIIPGNSRQMGGGVTRG